MASVTAKIERDSSIKLDEFVRRFSRTRRPIPVDFRKLVPTLSNPDRATHFIHPYPAKLLVQIPIFFLSNDVLSSPGEIVLDPFSGSGTVMLEAMLAGRVALGAESNPLARLISEVKTSPISGDLLKVTLKMILDAKPVRASGPIPQVVNIEKWFYPHVTTQLRRLLEGISLLPAGPQRKFFELCLSKCASKVSLADPRIAVPVRLNLEKYSEENPHREKVASHFRRLKRINVFELFEKLTKENICRMEKLVEFQQTQGKGRLVSCDAQNLFSPHSKTGLKKNSVSLVITSPPYPGAQKYIRSSTFGLGWLDLCSPNDMMELKRKTIGREEFRLRDCEEIPRLNISSIDTAVSNVGKRDVKRAAVVGYYLYEMRKSLIEIHNALKVGGSLVLVASNNQIAGRNFPTAKYLKVLCENIGFVSKFVLVDEISSRGLMTKRNKTAGIITREYVLLCEKVGATN